MSGHRYSIEEIEHAVWLYGRGWSLDEICAEVGCSRSRPHKWVKQHGARLGVQLRPAHSPQRLDDHEVRRLYRRFRSQRAVAEILGFSPAAIHRSLARSA
jgi:transposase-like protein